MKRPAAQLASEIGMFVFIVVMAAILHPYLIRYNSNIVWVLVFLIILGLLLLPGWLFNRQHRLSGEPGKSKIVKISRSLPLTNGDQIFVSSTGIGPMDGFKGFRATAVHDPQTERPRPVPIRTIVRWMAVLPVAISIYTLTATALIGAADLYSIPISDIAAYTVLFAVATLAAVFVATLTAPGRRTQVAGVLTLLLAGALVYLTARVALSGIHDTSLPPVVAGQLCAGLVATLLIWWKERHSALGTRDR